MVFKGPTISDFRPILGSIIFGPFRAIISLLGLDHPLRETRAEVGTKRAQVRKQKLTHRGAIQGPIIIVDFRPILGSTNFGPF